MQLHAFRDTHLSIQIYSKSILLFNHKISSMLSFYKREGIL